MNPRHPHRLALVLAAFAAAVAVPASVRAQDAKPATPSTPPPAASPAQPPATTPSSPPAPSLDDLLGIPKESAAGKPHPAAPDPTKTELDRKLTPGQVSEQFKQAIDLMGETADRLQSSKDTSLTTQRLQEDIIRKLDQLIKAAEQNQQQSRSRSQSKRDQQPQQAPDQSQSQRNPNGKEAAPDTMNPPARQDAAPNPGAAARGAAWGALPERFRDALLQGNADKYSSLYQRWTEAYYRRLAEDANK